MAGGSFDLKSMFAIGVYDELCGVAAICYLIGYVFIGEVPSCELDTDCGSRFAYVERRC